MNVYYRDGKLLIEIDQDIGNINDIIEYIKIKELFYKANKLTEKEINKFSEEVNQSYYDNFLNNLLIKRGIIENSN